MKSNWNNESICFTKMDLLAKFSCTKNTLDGRIKRAFKQGKLSQLKKGLYITTNNYLHEPRKIKFTEYLASKIYQPSYISLEYILEKHNLLAKEPKTITSITTKTTRTFNNFSGTYRYANIKASFYVGFEEHTFHGDTYHMATKAKAMFDYLYLNTTLKRRNIKHLRHQLLEELGIQWQNFSEEDFKEFDRHVWESNSHKMMRILQVVNEYFENKKFETWRKKLFQ